MPWGRPKPGTLKLAMVAQLSREPWASLAAWLQGRIWGWLGLQSEPGLDSLSSCTM